MNQRSSRAWGSRRTRAVAMSIASNVEAPQGTGHEQPARTGMIVGYAGPFSQIMQTGWVANNARN
jgi:hypothetical protein